MSNRLQIDQASIFDNDVAQQIEFAGEIDGDDLEFAVKYAVLNERSGDDSEDDALDMFELFGDEIYRSICRADREATSSESDRRR